MKTKEQIRVEIMAKAEAEIAAACKKFDILAALPHPPRYVHIQALYGVQAHVKYEVSTLEEAIAILNQFEFEPAFVCKGQFVSIRPQPVDKFTQIAAWLYVDKGTSSLSIYTKTVQGLLKISVEFPTYLVGYYKQIPIPSSTYKLTWQLAPNLQHIPRLINYAAANTTGAHSNAHPVYVFYEKDNLTQILPNN